MKYIKKLIVLILSAMLLFSVLASCNNGGNDDDGGDDIYKGETKTLMFEIDEGMGGYEFVSGCKNADGSYNYDRMDLILDNVYNGIKDLMQVYEVTVHLYANWYYSENGWNGKDPSNSINKWGDDLFYAMDYFKEKGIDVWLEIMSSGVYTNQNGELGTLPIVDIFDGTSGKTERRVKGVAADMAAIKALKTKYGSTFRGLRFHELIGTHNGGVAGNPHCYTIEEQDVFTIIDTCDEAGLQLVWSDHAWDEMYTINTYWKSRVLYAQEKLGKDLNIMWANNSGSYLTGYLNLSLFEKFKEDFTGSNLGFSNQNWFTSSFYLNRGTEPITGPAECDNPIELTAGFTVRAFMEGASIVQYEPSYQFFNWPRSLYVTSALGQGGTLPGAGTRLLNYTAPSSSIEGDDFDYSARVELKRLVTLLNAKSTQFSNVQDFYDTNQSKMSLNIIENPSKTYTQFTIAAQTESGYQYYDNYNNNPGNFLQQNENRFTENVLNSTTIHASRVLVNEHAYDEVLKAVEEDGKTVAYFYNARSGLLAKDTQIFADNDEGKFLTFTTANLLKNRVSGVNIDTDEIVVARVKDETITLSLYQAVTNTSVVSVDNSIKFRYQKVTSNVDAAIIDEMLGGKTFAAQNFIGLYGIRNTVTIGKTSKKRTIDGLVTVYRTTEGVRALGKRKEMAAEINSVFPIDGAIKAVTAGDVTLDVGLNDELIIAVEKNGNTKLYFYEFSSSNTSLIKRAEEIDMGSSQVKNLLSLRKAYFIYDSTLN